MKREIQKLEMKETGGEAHKNILLPKYVLNADLKVYEELDGPPKSLYKAVGYNDMERVKVIMDGDDKEKRSAYEKKESITNRSGVAHSGKANKKMLNAAEDELVEEARIT